MSVSSNVDPKGRAEGLDQEKKDLERVKNTIPTPETVEGIKIREFMGNEYDPETIVLAAKSGEPQSHGEDGNSDQERRAHNASVSYGGGAHPN